MATINFKKFESEELQEAVYQNPRSAACSAPNSDESNNHNWSFKICWKRYKWLLVTLFSILCVSILLVMIFLAFDKKNDRYYRTCKIPVGLQISRTQRRRFGASTFNLSTFESECKKIGGEVTLVSESKQQISLNSKGYQTLLKQLRKKKITYLEEIGLQTFYTVQSTYRFGAKATPVTYTVYLNVNFANKLLFFGPTTNDVLEEAKKAITREAWVGIIAELLELHGELPKALFKNYILH